MNSLWFMCKSDRVFFNAFLCIGVCFLCVLSNGHKAGSVCPLGCWNVHFVQQAASVLNRSCPSYCTSHTMSFSLSLCLSLFSTIYRQCFWWESGGGRSWLVVSVADVPVTAFLYHFLYPHILKDQQKHPSGNAFCFSFLQLGVSSHLCGRSRRAQSRKR